MTGGLEQKHKKNKSIENIKGGKINIADFFGAIFLWAINSVSTTLNNNFNHQSSSVKM